MCNLESSLYQMSTRSHAEQMTDYISHEPTLCLASLTSVYVPPLSLPSTLHHLQRDAVRYYYYWHDCALCLVMIFADFET